MILLSCHWHEGKCVCEETVANSACHSEWLVKGIHYLAEAGIFCQKRATRTPGSIDDRRQRSIKCSESNCISRWSKFGWNRGGSGLLKVGAGLASSRLRWV